MKLRLAYQHTVFGEIVFRKRISDVRVSNANAQSQIFEETFMLQETVTRKKTKYAVRLTSIEQASFTPLVLSCTGGASPLTKTFLKRLASLISDKHASAYSTTCVVLNSVAVK